MRDLHRHARLLTDADDFLHGLGVDDLEDWVKDLLADERASLCNGSAMGVLLSTVYIFF